jgi:hypothetical protein
MFLVVLHAARYNQATLFVNAMIIMQSQMNKLFCMPGAFPSLKANALAAKVRLALTALPDLGTRKYQFENALRENDDVNIGSLGGWNWWNDTLLFVLYDAFQEATKLGVFCSGRPVDEDIGAFFNPLAKLQNGTVNIPVLKTGREIIGLQRLLAMRTSKIQ